jgi:diaminobutyrate-2-oxoglutarate transaminase
MLLIRPEIDLWNPGEHNGTFRGNNHAFVTAKAALGYWHDPEFLSGMQANIKNLESWIDEMPKEFASLGLAPRGRGLIRGLACRDPTAAVRVCAKAYELGLIVETSGSRDQVVKIVPPLNIPSEQLSRGLQKLRAGIEHVARSGPH